MRPTAKLGVLAALFVGLDFSFLGGEGELTGGRLVFGLAFGVFFVFMMRRIVSVTDDRGVPARITAIFPKSLVLAFAGVILALTIATVITAAVKGMLDENILIATAIGGGLSLLMIGRVVWELANPTDFPPRFANPAPEQERKMARIVLPFVSLVGLGLAAYAIVGMVNEVQLHGVEHVAHLAPQVLLAALGGGMLIETGAALLTGNYEKVFPRAKPRGAGTAE